MIKALDRFANFQLSYFQDDYRFQSVYCFSIVIKKFDFLRATLTSIILIPRIFMYVKIFMEFLHKHRNECRILLDSQTSVIILTDKLIEVGHFAHDRLKDTRDMICMTYNGKMHTQ